MTDDTTRETTDEPTDDWPKQWAEITRTDPDANAGGDAALSAVGPGLPMVDFGHGLRAYDGVVYCSIDDADPPVLWEPLRVHVERMVADAIGEHTVDPSDVDELIQSAIAREATRADQHSRRTGDD